MGIKGADCGLKVFFFFPFLGVVLEIAEDFIYIFYCYCSVSTPVSLSLSKTLALTLSFCVFVIPISFFTYLGVWIVDLSASGLDRGCSVVVLSFF